MTKVPNCFVKIHELETLVNALKQLEQWAQKELKLKTSPCLRSIYVSPSDQTTALIDLGNLSIRLILKDDHWIVVSDALTL